MKNKYLWMLPVMSFTASTTAFSQAVADVPAANKVNKEAAQFDAQPAKPMFDKLAKLITDAAKDGGEDVDGAAILKVLGLGDVNSYAYSSEKQGSEFLNLLYLENAGSKKGIWPLLGGKSTKLSVPAMAPDGTDFAMQLRVNLKTLEALMNELMVTAKADEDEIGDFKDSMAEMVPGTDMTVSDLLGNINLRLNIALDLDKNEKLDSPMGQIDKPRMVIRIDNIKWIWPTIEKQIADAELPLNKVEKDGVITYTLPNQMADGMMGYLPMISMDTNKDQLWISSSQEFLTKCQSGENTLAKSMAFQAAMKGLPKDGSSFTYMSKDMADLIVEKIEEMKEGGMIDESPEMESMLKQLKGVQLGAVSNFTKDDTGVHFSSRSVQSFEEMIQEAQDQFQNAIQ